MTQVLPLEFAKVTRVPAYEVAGAEVAHAMVSAEELISTSSARSAGGSLERSKISAGAGGGKLTPLSGAPASGDDTMVGVVRLAIDENGAGD
jgi:hypothetical protein